MFRESFDLFSKSPKEVVEGRAATLARRDKLNEFSLGAIFFNPAGRITVASNNPDFTTYAFRIYDLIGLSRLIDLQRRIVADKTPLDGVGAALAKADAGLLDPYTEKPMQWDPATKRVSFVLHGKRFANFGYITLDHFK
jgi:hypothetical protein